MPLLGPNGKPISSAQFKKAPAPATGERFGSWGGESVSWLKMPGGGLVGFDLSTLTLNDFRQMKDHYQINSSLAILTFMMHQMEWSIDCEDKKLRDECERQLRGVWSRLVRAKSQSFWAGYSPNVLQWENDVDNRAIVLDKVKDLIPEDCRVHWKKVKPDGSVMRDSENDERMYLNNHIYLYDGIKQTGWADPIPVENSYWYPLLMENGDYYGKKLLRPAFQPWFFSILLHLFANRYYERFGEPTPVARAPYDDVMEYGGEEKTGNEVMEILLQKLRNRSTVVLPNDKTPAGDETTIDYDYTIEYLESQMRGADFEKYMTRLDEEMSLALFTPILMMRTADVGSYNLGDSQIRTYLWLLNAISEDWAHYINKYILAPIARFNSPRGLNHPKVSIKFRRVGKDNIDLVRDILRQGVIDGRYKPDLEEISQIAGLTMEEVRDLTLDDQQLDDAQKNDDGKDDNDPGGTNDANGVGGKITSRVAPQVQKAYRAGKMPATLDFGFEKAMRAAFESDHSMDDPELATMNFYKCLEAWVTDMYHMGTDLHETPESYMRAFNSAVNDFVKAAIIHG